MLESNDLRKSAKARLSFTPTNEISTRRFFSQAAGVYDGDGHTDLFFRFVSPNAAVNSPVVVIYMNGLRAVRSRTLYEQVGTEWEAFGVGDNNRDGVPDIYWRHKVAGQVVYWLLTRDGLATGAPLTSNGVVIAEPSVSDSGPWSAVDVADLDGDSKDNIVWVNTQNGAVVTWRLDGSNWLASTTVTTDLLLAGENYRYSGSIKLGNESGIRAIFQNRIATAGAATRGELRYISPGNADQTVIGESVNDLSWMVLKGTKISIP